MPRKMTDASVIRKSVAAKNLKKTTFAGLMLSINSALAGIMTIGGIFWLVKSGQMTPYAVLAVAGLVFLSVIALQLHAVRIHLREILAEQIEEELRNQ